MADYQSMMPHHEGEQHLLAAAYHVVKALRAAKNLSDDMRKVLADLDGHLSKMTENTESRGGEFAEVEEQLKCAENRILRWGSNQTMIRDTGTEEVSDYIGTIEEIQTLLESLRRLSVEGNGKHQEVLARANRALQMTMLRLKEELIHILVQHKQYFEPEYVSFRSCKDVIYDESFVSIEDESSDEYSRRVNCGRVSGDYIVDLIKPHVLPDIKTIANIMFAANYDQKFCEAYVGVRKDALTEYFVILKLKKFSIEDVLKMNWPTLSSEIKKWNWAMKIIIRVYLASEKYLCNKILGEYGTISSFCFVEIAKASLICLLNFGEAVAMSSVSPEKLFRLLDMYEVLEDLLLDIDGLLYEEAGSYIRIEFHGLLRKLGYVARAAFSELQIAIASNRSLKPFPQGGIHPLTRYVMNYIKTLTSYDKSLNVLLVDEDRDHTNPVVETANDQDKSPVTFCPLACHLRSVTSVLQCNLFDKSKLYTEEGLQHIFLMNNIHYMVKKVKGSDLRLFLGDEWIRMHNGKFQQHATSYERATWSSVLSFIRDCPHSNTFFKETPKERCRRFNLAFEEVYKSQTQWLIPDSQLKEDLQISSSLKVILAYRTFLARNCICDKYIKYSVDDVESLLMDLFEGSPKPLNSWQKR
ncbi:exocyst complex component EXO70E2-like [Mangifera indica]|uniref:exocyst complex component EXO70E2-like n=1 Tax=Mangifera indica TaxID=29780 RepID=UPI001CFA2A4F|nr:exocyst complex component EXO70E2-like [Mangifera indica]